MMTTKFTILEGLPPYGPEAISFPAGQLLAREGLVIRFERADEPPWIANFKKGYSNLDKVLSHPDGKRFIICAGGNLYLVDPEIRSVSKENAGVTYIQTLSNPKITLICDDVSFTAWDEAGVRWKTSRISWDGIRNVSVSENLVTGEAYTPLTDTWHIFEVDLCTGATRGNIYESDMRRFIEISNSTDKA